MNVFSAADILLPKVKEMEKWSVIACDQFTSQPSYWQDVEKAVGNAPSTLRLVLPEVYLKGDTTSRVKDINATMEAYLQGDLFTAYQNSYVYVERTLKNGTVRKGVLGKIDLEAYDYSANATSLIRATERTVVERIPPRKKVRENAALELPHILLLCDDEKKYLIEWVTAQKNSLPKLYDFTLMEGGGRVVGWLLQGEKAKAFDERMTAYAASIGEKYVGLKGKPMLFAVGDGNHSLATAKACYEDKKASGASQEVLTKARYALVELENIHDEAQQFEPIHRIVTGIDVEKLLSHAEQTIGGGKGTLPVVCVYGDKQRTIYLDENKGQLAVAVLQPFLDEYLKDNGGEIDYIHGDEAVKELAQKQNAVGFLLPAMGKGDLFRGIIADGVLPRKTFSMGHAEEKRYYLEAREIR